MEHSTQPTSCPICNEGTLSFVLDCPDHFLSKESFQLYDCNYCKVRITYPQPPPEKIFDYYKSEDYVSHSDTKKGLINFAYQQVKSITLRQKVRLLNKWSPGKKLLDYGCGTGDFLQFAQAKNYSVSGVEPDDSARQLAAKKSLVVHPLEWLNSTDRNFQAITLWHVLEHTYEPIKVLAQLKSKLEADGILVIAVPNYASLDAKHYGADWAAYDVPRHLFHFHPDTMKLVAEKLNLNLEAKVGMPFDSFYVSMLSEGYQNRFSPLGAITGLRSNIQARKTGNFSSMIYILRK